MVTQRTRNLTREQRRFSGSSSTIKDPFSIRQRNLTLVQRREVEQQKRQVIATAKNVSSTLRAGKFSSLSQVKAFYNSIPSFIKSRVRETPATVLEVKKKEYKDKIKSLDRSIDKKQDGLKGKTGSSRDRAKADIKGKKAEIAFFENLFGRVANGEFISLSSASETASKIGRQARNNYLLNKKGDKLKHERTAAFVREKAIFDKKVAVALKGKPDTVALFKLGVPAQTISDIVQDYAAGEGAGRHKNQLTAKFDKTLAEGQEGRSRLLTDYRTEVQAYKVGVNRELTKESKKFSSDFKPIPFTSSVDAFEKQHIALEKSRAEHLDMVEKIDFKGMTQKQKTDLKRKFNIGSVTVTPRDKELARVIFVESNKKLLKQQVAGFKTSTIVIPAVHYGQNLVKRNGKGERTPFWNDIKEVGREVKAATYDVGKDFGSSLGKFARSSIKAHFTYGVRIQREALKGNFVLDDDIKLLFKTVYKGVNTAREYIARTAKFVKNNPFIAGVMVATMLKGGADALYKKFKKDPVEVILSIYLALGIRSENAVINALKKLDPKFTEIIDGKIVLRKAPKETFKVRGKERRLKERVQKPSIKRPFKSAVDFLKGRKPGQFRAFTKDPGLILKTQTVASGSTPLSKAVELAGKTVTAVNAGRHQITSWLKRGAIIRKPFNLSGLEKKFPKGEKSFPVTIKTILKKFDTGKAVSEKEFAFINKWLQKNIAPNVTLLERSLYADPASGLRVSRLGADQERSATLKDILKGNFELKFGSDKPQVLIFENAKVAKFPKELKDVEKKLKAGKKLTVKETNRLIEWQVKTGSGKFKPIGSTIYQGGIELEVTLAPGELIKRIKRVGFTFINNKKVDFVTAEVYKPSKTLLDKIEKAAKGLLTDKQVVTLEKSLSKKLGRKMKVETPKTKAAPRRTTGTKPVLRVNGKSLRVVGKLSRAIKVAKRRSTKRKPSTRGTGDKRTGDRRTTTRKSTPRKPTPRRTTPRKPAPRKPAPRKPAARKTTPRKPTPRKPTPRKPTPRKPTPKKPTPPTPTPRKPVPRVIPNLGFDSKKLDNKILTFEGKFRERKFRSKPAGKKNPIITKVITIRDTKNRALKRVASRIDNSLAASLTLKVKGIGKAKKDIVKPKILSKFRAKKSKNTPVLQLVEKNKRRFDTKGEKREIKATKKRKKPVKKTKKRK